MPTAYLRQASISRLGPGRFQHLLVQLFDVVALRMFGQSFHDLESYCQHRITRHLASWMSAKTTSMQTLLDGFWD